MLRIVLPFIFFICIHSGAALAQVGSFHVGGHAGLGVRVITGSSFATETYNPGIGCGLGGAVYYQFSEVLSIVAGAGLERKGAAGRFQLTDEFGNELRQTRLRLNFDYLSIPLLARFHSGGDGQFFANAGPCFDFMVSARANVGDLGEAPERTDVNEQFDTFNLAAVVGVGYQKEYSDQIKGTIELRNSIGLWNISAAPPEQQARIMVNSAVIFVGVQYRLGG